MSKVMDIVVRTSRQSQMIQPLHDYDVLIIGAGSIGSNAAHMCLSTGIMNLVVIDPDKVEEENVFPAFLPMDSIGASKVDALQHWALNWMDSAIMIYDCKIEEVADLDAIRSNIIIVATDSIESRRTIWEMRGDLTNGNKLWWWIDGRMGAQLCEVMCFNALDKEAIAKYEESLNIQPKPLPCGLKATAPLTKGFIPGFIGQCLADISNDKKPPFLQRYDLQNRIHIILDN